MSAKKKKRPGAAQQLIDELLDEKTPAPHSVIGATDSAHHVDKSRSSTGDEIVFELEDDVSQELVLDQPPQKPNSGPFVKKPTAPGVPKPSAKPEADEHTATLDLAPSMTHQAKKTSASAAAPTSSHFEVSEFESDKTMQIETPVKNSVVKENHSRTQMMKKPAVEAAKVDRAGLTELKTVVQMHGQTRDRGSQGPSQKPAQRQSGGSSNNFTSPEASLKQSENLRIAQARISELEHELERLRRENESLTTAGDTLGRRTDELISKCEQLEMHSKEAKQLHEDEKKFFRTQVQAKERENADLRARIEEMEGRLESNFKKIRVRERELEHRLEIVRMESSTLVATKDKMLLDLKRQIDQLTHENDYAKQKSQELFNQFKGKQETIVRVVRALRMALDYLEGADDSNKKD